MEESTVKNTPKSSKRLRSSSGVNEITIKEKKSDKIITNGTGNISDHSEQEEGKAKAQPTKVAKVVKKTKGDTPKSVQKSAKKVEPETSNIEEPFLGFEEDELVSFKENTKLFLNHINGLATNGEPAASTSSSEAVAEAEVSEVPAEAEAEDVQEKETEEQDMTVDTAAATSDDTDSDQMEIDSKASDRADKSKESDVDVMDSELENSDKQTPKPDKENVGANAKVEYCGACSAQVDDAEEGICCDGVCERWFHLKCSGLSQAEYDELSLDENAKWACPKCSGKPPPTLAAEPKTPKISVRKDLQKTPGPSLAKRKSIAAKDGAVKTPKIDISNPAFLKPFDFGWKRELVYRTSNESVGNNKRNGDVYYYTPKGKKLRSLREISEHMAGTDLTIDNFTFWKEPLGIDNPEKEIIRDAKYKLQNKDGTASPSLVAKKLPATPKAVKTPKTTPKLSATITLPVSESTTPKASLAVTPRVMLKGKANATVTPKVKIAPSKTVTPKPVISKGDNRKVDAIYKTWIVAEKARRRNSLRSAGNQSRDFDLGYDKNAAAETEKKKKNKFRRYGLLANRRNSNSPSGSDDSSDSEFQVAKPRGRPPKRNKRGSNLRKKSATKAPTLRPEPRTAAKVAPVSPFSRVSASPGNSSATDSPPNAPPPYLPEPDHSFAPSLGLNRKRPSPPEFQFRPSNPSTYGCQKSPLVLPGPSVHIDKTSTPLNSLYPPDENLHHSDPLTESAEVGDFEFVAIGGSGSSECPRLKISSPRSLAPQVSMNNDIEVIQIPDDDEEDIKFPPALSRSSPRRDEPPANTSPPQLHQETEPPPDPGQAEALKKRYSERRAFKQKRLLKKHKVQDFVSGTGNLVERELKELNTFEIKSILATKQAKTAQLQFDILKVQNELFERKKWKSRFTKTNMKKEVEEVYILSD